MQISWAFELLNRVLNEKKQQHCTGYICVCVYSYLFTFHKRRLDLRREKVEGDHGEDEFDRLNNVGVFLAPTQNKFSTKCSLFCIGAKNILAPSKYLLLSIYDAK